MSLFSRRIPATAAAAAVLAGGSLLGATAAQAAPPKPYGTVTAKELNVRQYPSTDSSSTGLVKKGQEVPLDCKVHAQNVAGNTIWYKLRTTNPEKWVAARYVTNHGSVKLCKDAHPTAMDSTEQSKNAKG